MHRKILVRQAALALAVAALVACASKDSPTYDKRDPFEPINRVSFKINDTADRIFFRHVAAGYEKVVPNVARQGINNFFTNIGVITDMVNNVLQGKVREGLSDSVRFALNFTLGWGGFFDPATAAGLAKHNEDFGQTLGVWGVPPGPYLMLPLLGPHTVRSAVGFFTLDRQTRVLRYDKDTRRRHAILALNVVRIRANLLFLNEQLDRSYDPYVFVRDAILQRQRFLRYDGRPPETGQSLDDDGFDDLDFEEDEDF
jgi:phospholipid-binding lipoprotein MlaA